MSRRVWKSCQHCDGCVAQSLGAAAALLRVWGVAARSLGALHLSSSSVYSCVLRRWTAARLANAGCSQEAHRTRVRRAVPDSVFKNCMRLSGTLALLVLLLAPTR